MEKPPKFRLSDGATCLLGCWPDRVPRPDLLGRDYLIWCGMQGYPDTLRATCGAQENIESLLDDWSAALLKRLEAMYHQGHDRPYMKRIADFALCAAPLTYSTMEVILAVCLGPGARPYSADLRVVHAARIP
jgi:hypothetical protein